MDQPYNSSCDAYSFGIIFWQICSLTTPYAGYNQKMHSDRVVRQGQRPTPDPTWPMSWVDLMQRCWDRTPTERPDFDVIVDILQDRYYEMEEQGDDVLPTRANEIKAKKRKKKVAPENQMALDVDTRIASATPAPGGHGAVGIAADPSSTSKRFDAEVV